MKGYKGFNQDMTCLDMQYEQGKTYELDGSIALCERGFHFCENLSQCFGYYDKFKSRFFEIEAGGNIKQGTDKNCCDRITIGREIIGAELNKVIYGNGYDYGDGDGNGYGYGYGNGKQIQRILTFKED